MALDKVSNFAKTTITGIASGVTGVVLDDATNFLDPASGEYNCVIWEISNYGNPADDPNKEIVRAISLSGSTLGITRAQESTSDVNHNTGGETYAIANVLTAKMINDIETAVDAKAPLASPTFTGTVTLPKTTKIQDTSADHTYNLAVSELTADRTVILPLLTGNDEFVFKDHTQTLTKKRINPRLVTAASYTTNTGTSLDVSTCDQFEITAQAGDLKFNNPSGTPLGGQKLIIRIKDNGTARALTYDTYFRAVGVELPATTVKSKTLYMGFIFNATDTKWDLLAVASEE